MRLKVFIVVAALLAAANAWSDDHVIRVASKNFNESYILAESAAQLLESGGFEVERRFGLGGTLICFQALENDEIDVYVEYSGTLEQVILKLGAHAGLDELRSRVRERNLALLAPLGFNNTYALALRSGLAQERGLARISDLSAHPDLRVVVSHEFLEREDGWPGLAAAYGLVNQVTGIEHGLAYQAINQGTIDVTDAYSTDGELARYELTLLEDDKGFFPAYLAVPLVRADLDPAAQALLSSLGNTFTDASMQALNAQVVFGGQTFAQVAREFLASQKLASTVASGPTLWENLGRNTLVHLKLTGIALGFAVVAGIGLSLLVFRNAVASRALLYVSGLMQTIPSIALLALMIPLLGIGAVPAIVALFLYSLLPMLRNTITALTTIDPTLIRVAIAMGLSGAQQLRHVYVPLSMPSILAGVRTAAVISIGTATLAAFIGAGGLGDPIVTGLALNDVGLILQGAVPAALLAIVTELVFEGVERLVLPGHMRRQ
ncbi:MAG: ABC transporter permease [Gammaproteobacteria bacterium]|nr:ABC transporter permease [Gammaproteobacteria bacterium]